MTPMRIPTRLSSKVGAWSGCFLADVVAAGCEPRRSENRDEEVPADAANAHAYAGVAYEIGAFA